MAVTLEQVETIQAHWEANGASPQTFVWAQAHNLAAKHPDHRFLFFPDPKPRSIPVDGSYKPIRIAYKLSPERPGYGVTYAARSVLYSVDKVALAYLSPVEANTGAAWHAPDQLIPKRDGAVIPVVHLVDAVDNSQDLSSIPDHRLQEVFRGMGWEALFTNHDLTEKRSHWDMAAALELAMILAADRRIRGRGPLPLIVLRTPTDWPPAS